MTGKSADILNMEEARAKRKDFAASTGFDTAGAFLKNVRESKGLSLVDISARTHIREQHLRGIETGDLSLLPARAYVSGFVKTYAEFLDLDPVPVVNRFKEDVGLQAPAKVDPAKFETAEDKARDEPREMSLWAVLGVFAFILWCVWQIVRPADPATVTQSQQGFPLPSASQTAPAILDPLSQPPVEEAGALDDSVLSVPARITERIEPVYPRFCEARANAVETVELTFNISSAGRVAGARVLSSSNPCFERASVNALKRWRFAPQQLDGRARPSYDQVITLTFHKPA